MPSKDNTQQNNEPRYFAEYYLFITVPIQSCSNISHGLQDVAPNGTLLYVYVILKQFIDQKLPNSLCY